MSELLRADLEALRANLGLPSLQAGLQSAGIKRILEVGIGYDPRVSDYDGINQLVAALKDTPNFNPDDLVTIDPMIESDQTLGQRGNIKEALPYYRRYKIGVEQMAKQVGSHQTPAFDLVISRGLVAYGYLRLNESIRDIHARAIRLTGELTDCLKQRGLLVLSDIHDNIALPISDSDLVRLGLRVHRTVSPKPFRQISEYLEDEENEPLYIDSFKRDGTFSYDFVGYNQIIAAKA